MRGSLSLFILLFVNVLVCADDAEMRHRIMADRFPQIKMQINGGRKIWGLIDTGAINSILFYTGDMPPQLTRNPRVWMTGTTATPIEVLLHENVPISVSGMPVISGRVGVYPRQVRLDEILRYPFDGIVGFDYLKRFCLKLNLSQGIADIVPDIEQHNGFEKIPLDMWPSWAEIGVDLGEGYREWGFRLDTGMNSTLNVRQDICDVLVLQGLAVALSESHHVDLAGEHHKKTYILKQVTVAGKILNNIEVHSSRVNLIGNAILSHFDITFDFPKATAHVAPASGQYIEPLGPVANGFSIGMAKTDKDRFVINSAIEKSLPAGVVIKEGDEVICVDGKPAKELGLNGMWRLMHRIGETRHLVLKRGDRVFEVDLPLKLNFEYPPNWEKIAQNLPPKAPRLPDDLDVKAQKK